MTNTLCETSVPSSMRSGTVVRSASAAAPSPWRAFLLGSKAICVLAPPISRKPKVDLPSMISVSPSHGSLLAADVKAVHEIIDRDPTKQAFLFTADDLYMLLASSTVETELGVFTNVAAGLEEHGFALLVGKQTHACCSHDIDWRVGPGGRRNDLFGMVEQAFEVVAHICRMVAKGRKTSSTLRLHSTPEFSHVPFSTLGSTLASRPLLARNARSSFGSFRE